MNTTTEREELIELLDNERWKPMAADPTDNFSCGIIEQSNPSVADAILAAGYRKPRTITEPFEDNGPDELAPLSVVLSAGKPAIMQHDGTFMDYDGSSWDTWEMTYPLTVIWEPASEPTR